MQDVVVIGAGPAGNGAALELARAGHKVTVVDYRDRPGEKLCTGIVSVQCLQEFPPTVPVTYRETNCATVVSPSGKRLHLAKDGPQACVIDRVAYVSDIGRQAADAGAKYLLGRAVRDIVSSPDGVRLLLDPRDGGQVLEARVCVIASGFGSPFTSRLGLGRSTDYALGAQVEVLAPDVQEIEVYLGKDVAPGFFAWLVPTCQGKALLGLLSRSGVAEQLRRLTDRLQTQGKIVRPIGPLAKWGIPLRPLEDTVADRVLVVGDAAGQVKPTTGGGIYYALLSSRIAARAIDGALRSNRCSAAGLRSYDREWRDLLGKELEAGERIRGLAERLSDWQLDQVIGIVGHNGFLRGLLTSSDVSFDWHGKLAQRVLGFPTLVDSMKLLGFTDLWRRLTRVKV